MKKTFITTMPDHAGAFLAASRIIAGVGANITRVSYNKAVDTHTLFIDAAGTAEQLAVIAERLTAIGYIQNQDGDARVMLLDFVLRDVPGAVQPVLELIDRYRFNISYINSQENGTDFQNFRMGLLIERPEEIKSFLEEAAQLCELHIVDYDGSEQVLDNTVFYMSFANSVAKKLKLTRDQSRELMAQSNLIMQMLDERQEPPYKTFEYIGRFADMLAQYKGERFQPRVTHHTLSSGFELRCIEPPCGSNTYILQKDNHLLFVDTGFACYAPEMSLLLRRLIPGIEGMERAAVITHPDEDHCGLLGWFDTVYVSRKSWEFFELEHSGRPNFRLQNPAHAPYTRISCILSRYTAPGMEVLRVVEGEMDDPDAPICLAGHIDFCGKRLDIYRGNGGHAVGEIVIVDEEERLVFSGDIEVNPAGFTAPQAAFNQLAPYLMKGVNMDSRLFRQERRALLEQFSHERYTYCCGHGAIMDTMSL